MWERIVSNKSFLILSSELNLQGEKKLKKVFWWDYKFFEKNLFFRDNVEHLMHTFLAREAEIGGLLLKYFELKKEYHLEVRKFCHNFLSKLL